MKGSSKKFGVRYGRRLRLKHEGIETEQKTKYQCPYCHKIAVKRMSAGIWTCPKCAAVFTGRAYNVPKKPGIDEQQQDQLIEKVAEEPEEYAEEEQQGE
jgi:large subunit ribosomal protein L37Ae